MEGVFIHADAAEGEKTQENHFSGALRITRPTSIA
jgi:hypothetical protein